MSQEKAKTVRVGCKVPNGVMIRLSKQGYDDGTGFKPMVADGPGVRLAGTGAALEAGTGITAGEGQPPGITDVDAEWWRRWLKQHELDPFVTGKHIFEIEDDGVDAKTDTAGGEGLETETSAPPATGIVR